MLTIQGKSLGRTRPLFADFSVPPPDGAADGGITLRDLIAAVVRHEVKEFSERQEQRRFLRALTEREIAEGVAQGRVAAGDSDVPPQGVASEDAVATALQAFEDGIYLVVVDDDQKEDLDAEVLLSPESRVTFLRLTLLAGG